LNDNNTYVIKGENMAVPTEYPSRKFKEKPDRKCNNNRCPRFRYEENNNCGLYHNVLKCDIKLLKEKPMNKIEKLEQTIKDAESSIQHAKEQIEEIKEQDNDENWTLDSHYSFDLSEEDNVERRHRRSFDFKDLKNFNLFEEKEHAELWAVKINANLKLWHIAQKLNEGWEPTNPIWFFYIDETLRVIKSDTGHNGREIYFKTKELAEKAKELMGDMLEDLYLEIY
jgi:hypothetical protein